MSQGKRRATSGRRPIAAAAAIHVQRATRAELTAPNPMHGIMSGLHHMSISGRCGPTRGFINIRVITIIMDIIPIRIGAPPIIIAFMNFTSNRLFIDSGLVAASRLRSNFFR